MIAKRSLERKIEELAALEKAPVTEASLLRIRQRLRDGSGGVVARAARTAARLAPEELLADLEEAFRQTLHGMRRDPGCVAAAALAEVLRDTGRADAEIFIAGVRHRQPEPGFGGPVDAAASLRAVCAAGLVESMHPEALPELARLLADPEAEARTGAARALAATGTEGAELLLRHKACVGDSDSQVLAACMDSLLELAAERGVELLEDLLDRGQAEIREAAALALGESRLEEAFPVLKAAWEHNVEPGFRRTLLLAMAMLRSDEALELLFGEISAGSPAAAGEAIEALGLYMQDVELAGRIRGLVRERGSLDLERLVDKLFPEV